jgi:hypothetical protein
MVLKKKDFLSFLFPSRLISSLGDNTTHKWWPKKSNEGRQLNRRVKKRVCFSATCLTRWSCLDWLGWLRDTEKTLLPKRCSSHRTARGKYKKKEPSSITRQKKKRLNASAPLSSIYFFFFILPYYHKHHHIQDLFKWIERKKGQPETGKDV